MKINLDPDEPAKQSSTPRDLAPEKQRAHLERTAAGESQRGQQLDRIRAAEDAWKDLTLRRLEKIDEIVRHLVKLPWQEREPYLEEACMGDGVMRSMVESVLRDEDATTRSLITTDLPPGLLSAARHGAYDTAGGLGFEQDHILAQLSQNLFGMAPEPVRLGRFVILDRLGKGGMGVVYSAYDPELDRKVALKLLREDSDGIDSIARERLRREAQALARLSHPNIVPVYDVAILEGRVAVVMEFVKGRTLRDWIADESPTWRHVLDRYVQAGRGLAAAHAAGIIHRDFKPDNVLVGDDGRVRVADFGLSRAYPPDGDAVDVTTPAESSDVSASVLDVPLTATGTVMGTPAYMAPEQFAGKAVDRSADQFALCVSLYEGLYGERPFAGKAFFELAATIKAGVISPAPADSEVPAWLRRIIVRGLARDPAERWPTTDALIVALTDDPVARWRRRLRIALVAILLAATVLGLGWIARSAQSKKIEAQSERDRAYVELENELKRSRDASRMLALESLRPDPTQVLAMVRDVEDPDSTPLWYEQAAIALRQPVARAVLEGHAHDIHDVAISPDGTHVATASKDRTARIWSIDGLAPPVVLSGHTDAVDAIDFSPDGTLVVMASRDRTARIWKVTGGDPPVVLRGHQDRVREAVFSPDGSRVATASEDGTVRLWRADGSGEPIVLSDHATPVYSVAFSPDGASVVSASADQTARIWSVDRSRDPIVLTGHTGAVFTAAFSRDGTRVLTASLDKTVRVWSLASKQQLARFDHTDYVWFAALSPDGLEVATCGNDKLVRIWNADGSGEPIVLRGHTNTVQHLAFSPDGERLVTASLDRTARIWRIDGRGSAVVLEGHRGPIARVAFSRDGTMIVSGAADKTARVWPATPRRTSTVLQGHVSEIAWVGFSPNGERIATASFDHTARLWRSDGSGEPVILRGHQAHLIHADFSPGSTLVATASKDGTARIWRTDGSGDPVILRGHTSNVNSAVFSPDGTKIVTSSVDTTARVWNVDGAGSPVVLAGHSQRVNHAEFAPDGKRILTQSDDQTARIWKADGSGEPIVLAGHTADLFDAEFSPDGSLVATSAADGTARIWRADGSIGAIVLSHPAEIVRCVRFSPDGVRLATCASDNIVRIWRVDGTGPVTVLAGHRGTVWTVTFSPDGSRILTVSDDRTARVWNADGSGHPAVLSGHRDTVFAGAFSPDGRHIVTGSFDAEARIWDDAMPLSSLDNALWRATTYCLPPVLLQQLLGASQPSALAHRSECLERVARRHP